MSDDLTTMRANGVLPVSVRDREQYAVAGTARVYHLAPLSVGDRGMVSRAVIALCGTYPSDDEVRETLEDAIATCLEPEEATSALALLAEVAAMEAAGADDDEARAHLAAQQKRLERVRGRLSRQHAGVRELIAARATWIATWVDCTMRATVRGWEGLDAPCTRRAGFVLPTAFLAVPEVDLPGLQARCTDLQEVGRDLEQGSASP
jgi:hypothetical protein